MNLFRPVGLKELRLIAKANWRTFPPRLPEQPIFYPVLSHEYARLICQRWNAQEADADFAGFVTRFDVDDRFVARYPIQIAGGQACQELWVPAEELDEFNRHIVGTIQVIESIFGQRFAEPIDPQTQLPRSIVQVRDSIRNVC